MPLSFDAADLSRRLGGTLVGPNVSVSSLAPYNAPKTGAIIVATTPKELERLAESDVAAFVVPKDFEGSTRYPLIKVDNPRLALAQLTQLFDTHPPVAEGIHASAYIHPEANLAEDVHLAAGVVVGAGTHIGAGTRVGANCVIGDNATVGANCTLHPQVTLYSGVTLGERVNLHSGVVVGADGFGYTPSAQGAVKVHHLGTVVLEDDVEIGANTCIDRGTLGETRIGARSKIDNLCQIGHNVTMGSDCLIAGTVGIAGSTRFGNRVTIGGAAGIGDHLTIGDDVRIAARAGVTKDIPSGETWAGFPAQPYKRWVRGLYLQGRLETLWQFFKSRRAE